MQNSQLFFVKFCKHWVKVRNNWCFQGLRFDLAAFLLFLFTYQGELSSFMQNSQLFFVKFCKHWVEVRNNRCFWGLRFGLVAFLLFLFTYRGELSSFMQKSQVFFDKVLQTLVEVRNNGCFWDLRAIANHALSPQSGRESIPCLIAQVLSKRTK